MLQVQVEGRIRAGPRADLDAFLAALVRLEGSIAYFQQNRCSRMACQYDSSTISPSLTMCRRTQGRIDTETMLTPSFLQTYRI